MTDEQAIPAPHAREDAAVGSGSETTAAGASTPARATAKDGRLDAVLDVDLPLVVRFGRAVMPLRALSDLGPGAVIDMGRSPDEPVELVVGDRVIARGEVVIVAGNYGVRITEIEGQSNDAAMESEASRS